MLKPPQTYAEASLLSQVLRATVQADGLPSLRITAQAQSLPKATSLRLEKPMSSARPLGRPQRPAPQKSTPGALLASCLLPEDTPSRRTRRSSAADREPRPHIQQRGCDTGRSCDAFFGIAAMRKVSRRMVVSRHLVCHVPLSGVTSGFLVKGFNEYRGSKTECRSSMRTQYDLDLIFE